ncbi:hypothetical protein O1611_g3387 [Lasiodiplodia mahajangana]|uniref:Uncharacterized protein n=1 Tax=Lasiodiplodia mahajangana TaxID=1108764 RepID=A0ACC2JRX3_9PEZI|nr:hypothetical protein O1611_g3387 [Lasiodiplodia mahajangana]
MASSPPHRVNSPLEHNNLRDSGYSENDLEPWRSNGNENEDEPEGDGEQEDYEENNGSCADGDDSSEVGPEILNDISDGESEDERERSRRRPRKSNPRPTACSNCGEITRRWHSEVDRLVKESEATERRLNARIRELESEIERLRARGRIEWQPWAGRLENLLGGGFRRFDINGEDGAYPGYDPIYRDSCRQGNMSILLSVTHPDLSLEWTPHTPVEIQNHFRDQALRDRYNGLDDLGATNTFAFSSLGEFGRFCNGIGKARVGRLVNVELMWQGALTPRQEKGVSLRKQPLAWFMHTSRLRSLVVHINESGKSYMRRPYEMMHPKDYYEDFAAADVDEDDLDIFGMEVRRTTFQPNFRKNRSMRTVQGMDFIYQLRGMRRVRFCDVNADQPDTEIRDWSFIRDINSVVRMKKTDAAMFKAEIENLKPLTGLADFIPDDEIKELVLSFYNDNLVEDISTYGSEAPSSSSSGISRVQTLSDGSESDTDRDSRGSSRSRDGSPSSHIEIDDSDTEMGDNDDDDEDDDDDAPDRPNDNGPPPQEIDGDNAVTESGPSSRSRSSSNDNNPNDTSATSIRPPPIVIEDDDANDNIRRRTSRNGGDYSTDGGLFVRSGSCTAPEDPPSGDENQAIGGRQSTTLIDLTGDNDEHQVDDDEVEEVENPNNDDDREKSIKTEESATRSPSGPHNSDSDSDTRSSQKRSRSKGKLD